jgi:hypothetical protein
MKTTNILKALILIIFVILISTLLYSNKKKPEVEVKTVQSFDECVQAGNPVMESYPRQCRADSKTFVEKIKEDTKYLNASADQIKVKLPPPNAVVGKDFSVVGEARGTWFFEASFPIEVLDMNGKVIAQSPAHAESDWMTSEFVGFKADIKILQNYIGKATLVLKKDNPSGLESNDASISYPITIEY